MLKSAARPGTAGATPDSAKTRKLISEEMERVLGSREFSASERSCALLRYLVESALDGSGHQLKERTIGVDLFGRDASYDTGRDAIVRVSANGVRKRLLAHYAKAGLAREPGRVQISLPAGSYMVEFHILPLGQDETALREAPGSRPSPPISVPKLRWRWPAAAWAVIGVLGVACGLLVWYNHQLLSRVPPAPGMEFLPWSQFGSQKVVRVVLTD